MKALISLISEQQIPNVLFIRHIKPDYNIFVTTQQMEKIKQSDKIINTLSLEEKKVRRIIVDSENISEIINSCIEEIKKLKDSISEDVEFIINLTGGTKTMALAVHELAKMLGAKTYYLPRQLTKFIKIYPEIFKESIELDLSNFTVKDYFNSYMLTERDSELIKLFEPSYDFDKAKSMLKNFKEGLLKGEVYKKLREEGRKKNLRVADDVKEFLSNIGFKTENQEKIDQKESKYITGGWFEEYVYYFVKEKFKINEIHCGLKRLKGEQSIDNEFDVIFLNGLTLNIIECKTSLTEHKPADLFNDTVYKSAALLKNMGLSAKTAIVTLENLNNEKGERKKDFDERAKYFGIKLIDQSQVLDENKFQEELKSFIR
ncbi:MAG: DUF1887 family protein [Elusimicrobia bacterium]|nr:DUF1887 family protein [Elusimicrobiota bacterium]